MCAIPPAGVFPVGQSPDAFPEALTAVGAFAADAIDPATGDFRSISRGVHPVEAAALEALRVHAQSGSAVWSSGSGSRLHEIEFVDDAAESTLRADVAYAWRRLIAERQIELESVTIDADGDTVLMTVKFRNLVAQESGAIRVPLLALAGAQ